ncbi:hypothetical protein NP493_1567g00014 [Ridgeia piscesae]|uniref:Chitin-binding type-2 domain-containing protein n=1 Tax=Ridgeia piscesae TaxID=27915 RepID=A0AAD9JZ21_RIDPI|nr:hypothetical protein NP493_1567g00014 [Ridgeia piscesae]
MSKLFILLALFAAVLAYASADRCRCVCDRRDGDYPNTCTYDCRHYISCRNGRVYFRRCPHGGFFDADRGCCIEGCPTGPRGIIDCFNRPDGHWQHCCYCDLYASLAHGGMFFHRRCEVGGTVWDDKEHKCLGKSCTCRREHRFYPAYHHDA